MSVPKMSVPEICKSIASINYDELKMYVITDRKTGKKTVNKYGINEIKKYLSHYLSDNYDLTPTPGLVAMVVAELLNLHDSALVPTSATPGTPGTRVSNPQVLVPETPSDTSDTPLVPDTPPRQPRVLVRETSSSDEEDDDDENDDDYVDDDENDDEYLPNPDERARLLAEDQHTRRSRPRPSHP